MCHLAHTHINGRGNCAKQCSVHETACCSPPCIFHAVQGCSKIMLHNSCMALLKLYHLMLMPHSFVCKAFIDLPVTSTPVGSHALHSQSTHPQT